MPVAKVYVNGQWVSIQQGSDNLVSHDYLDRELSFKSDFDHNHDDRYASRFIVGVGTGQLNATGSGDFWIPTSGGLSWTGNGWAGAQLFRIKRSDWPPGKRVRLRGALYSNSTAYGGTADLRVWESSSTSTGGAGVVSLGGADRMAAGTISLTANLINVAAWDILLDLNSTNFPTDDGVYSPYIRTSASGTANAAILVQCELSIV